MKRVKQGRKKTKWDILLKEVYEEMKAVDSSAKYKDAMIEAKKRYKK